MAPPDENLVAILATLGSFAIILPLLVKWWPRVLPKRYQKKPEGTTATKKRPAEARKRIAPEQSARSPRVVRPTSARTLATAGRPRRPS